MLAFVYRTTFTSPSAKHPARPPSPLLSGPHSCGDAAPNLLVSVSLLQFLLPTCLRAPPGASSACRLQRPPCLSHLTSCSLPSLCASHAAPSLLKCLLAARRPSVTPHSPASLWLSSLPSAVSPRSPLSSCFSLKATWGSENLRIQSDAAYVTLTVTSESQTLFLTSPLMVAALVPP